MSRPPVIVGISGASGAALGLSVVEQLRAVNVAVALVVTPAAERTLATEVDKGALDRLREMAGKSYEASDIGADIASGSFPVAGMLIAPCSMRSLGAIAHSLNDNLLVRAADVQLKERRPLVVIAREAPLHLGHLRSMSQVTEMGGIILPPAPAFYLRPKTVQDIIDQIAARAIDLLRLGPPLAQSWRASDQAWA
ncbi:UbiX family flavin prenyltransferase [Candidatus Halocynthiibacter alkanivorans]|uniref:UbiX family flavin prenyltransferase n=1 Tax=Candidatus Halocynthiibacter alkanivorans TaxID=2267619 RepID=UPI000DF1CCC4|nr:UbiX family flavin prenyltransferase [Candidatus Halocynthiibacter alkanivorans]